MTTISIKVRFTSSNIDHRTYEEIESVASLVDKPIKMDQVAEEMIRISCKGANTEWIRFQASKSKSQQLMEMKIQ